MKYELHTFSGPISRQMIFDTELNCWIPLKEGNPNYKKYLAWLQVSNEGTESGYNEPEIIEE